MGGPSARHGSGAGRQFERERDRDRRGRLAPLPPDRRIRDRQTTPQQRSGSVPVAGAGDARAQATAYRNIPQGPQEEQDFTDALSAFSQRVDSLESNARQHAACISAHDTKFEAHKEEFKTVYAKIDGVIAVWIRLRSNPSSSTIGTRRHALRSLCSTLG